MGSRITSLRESWSPPRGPTGRACTLRPSVGAAMGRLVVHGGILLALLTPAIASELPTPLHAALWPLSAPGSVYPSARITGLQKPQEAPANDGTIDFRSRTEGQEPVRALTP